MYKKINTDKADTTEPTEETAFKNVKVSGKSGILLGIPLNPRKCIGKNVKFTPINNTIKCTTASVLSYAL